ncbi:YopX family protein [Cytobacillus pseudoceanisediminis]|uniref:YopX family protein n=1 Tax=Cytobacillus pseudoceanisediminis TaxID=3051614 RepID=UPI003C2DF400
MSLNGDLFQSDDLDYKNKSSFEIMQYTGLKDKNGKEIYEGDILKITCNFYFRKGIEIDKVVWWEKGGWLCNDWTLSELIDNHEEGEQEFEVIGNIYENPSLLEAAE